MKYVVIVTQKVTEEQIEEMQETLSDIIGGIDNHTMMVLDSEDGLAEDTKLDIGSACVAMIDEEDDVLVHLNIERA